MSKVTDKLNKLLKRFETMEIGEYEKLYDEALRDIQQFAGYAKGQFYVEKEMKTSVTFKEFETKVTSEHYSQISFYKNDENREGNESNNFSSDYIPAA